MPPLPASCELRDSGPSSKFAFWCCLEPQIHCPGPIRGCSPVQGLWRLDPRCRTDPASSRYVAKLSFWRSDPHSWLGFMVPRAQIHVRGPVQGILAPGSTFCPVPSLLHGDRTHVARQILRHRNMLQNSTPGAQIHVRSGILATGPTFLGLFQPSWCPDPRCWALLKPT